ncbi:hypothetical protein PM082_018897 [Marasmius tenuissimus]|nr:hypothetical protein PM082_018897 [Marasmius tenuissimus]
MLNQAPPDLLDPKLRQYWHYGYDDRKIASLILADISKDLPESDYGLSAKTIQRARKRIGLKGTRQQNVSFEEMAGPIGELKKIYPMWGARTLTQQLRIRHSMKVPEDRVAKFLMAVEPEQVKARKYQAHKRRVFHCAGIMDIISVDQHDKWKKWGLYPHLGVEVFSGRLMWMKIWWTNSNPRLVCSYYLDGCESVGGVPMTTQSDPGTENNGIANCHTWIRQKLDPDLEGTLQHRWMKQTKNVKPEIQWSIFRRMFTPKFEELLEEGETYGFYNPNDPDSVERLTFRWVAIPFFQQELDDYVASRNSTPQRANKKKILPGGIPDHIFQSPEVFNNSKNFTVTVSKEVFEEARNLYAPPNDPVFELVPPVFDIVIKAAHSRIGSPAPTYDTFWGVYMALLAEVREACVAIAADMESGLAREAEIFNVHMELMPGQRFRPGMDNLPGPAAQPVPNSLVSPSPCSTSVSPEVENEYWVEFSDDEDDEDSEAEDGMIPRFVFDDLQMDAVDEDVDLFNHFHEDLGPIST